jgi:hypothetical protein
MSLIHNERAKLTATYLNGLAIALFAVGSLAPVFNYGFGPASFRSLWTMIGTATICLAGSIVLHLVARRTLKGLIP